MEPDIETNDNSENKKFPLDLFVYDKSNYRAVIKNLPSQLLSAYKLGSNVVLPRAVKKIIVCGMGGSGIVGDFLQLLVESVDVVVNKDYYLPRADPSSTLVLAVSYSGNTEETLSCYKAAVREGFMVVAVTSGGKLEELSNINKNPVIIIPKGLQPRAAIAHLLVPILRILENNNLLSSQTSLIESVADNLSRKNLEEEGKRISEKLVGKLVLIYASKKYYPIAYRWKTQFNENSKTLAYSSPLPELCHNEIEGFKNQSLNPVVIILSTDEDHRRVAKRIDILKDLFQKGGVPVVEIATKGPVLHKLFSLVHLGDWISYYLALRYKTDPEPVSKISELKERLGPYIV